MIFTPQEAGIMQGRPYQQILTSLQRAYTVGLLKPLADSVGDVVGVIDGEDIPSFSIPIKMTTSLGKSVWCVDLRRAVREFTITPDTKAFTPKLLTDTAFFVNHALMQKTWMMNSSSLFPIYADSCKVYAMWIASKITKRLVLPPEVQPQLLCYFAYYYLTRNVPEATLSPVDLSQIINRICLLFGFQVSEATTILSPINGKVIDNLDEICQLIRDNINNPKLNKFNRILLQSILIGGWFGGNSRELVALATEYPPTFISLMYRALTERTFKDTEITQLTLRLLNSNKQKAFVLTYDDVLYRAKKQ